MIKAIIFDAAGTLIHLPRGVGWHYREVAARHGIILDEARLTAAFGPAFKAAGPRTSGMSAPFLHDDDKSWWRALVRRLLTACGQDPAEPLFTTMFEDLYAHFAQPGVWALYPEVLPVLETLRSRYKLAIVSNFDRRLHPVLEHLGIRHYFDPIIISSELGIDKPDPRIFTAALTALAVTPAETIHAGDDPTQDWLAAEAAGLHAYKVDRPTQGLESLPDFARALAK
jgi:putative hydrolase of the HAD superfamily